MNREKDYQLIKEIDKLAIAPSTVTRFVDKLTERGLVERKKEKVVYQNYKKRNSRNGFSFSGMAERINDKFIKEN